MTDNINIAEQLTRNHKDFEAEGFSEYMNGYYNGIIAGLEYTQNKPNSTEDSCPEWLTTETCILVKETWNSHKDINDRKRVEAMQIIQKVAFNTGYTIGIKKATELLHKFCLK